MITSIEEKYIVNSNEEIYHVSLVAEEKQIIESNPIFANYLGNLNETIIENLNGTVNNINKSFSTEYNFKANSTAVFVNGLKQRVNIDYIEKDSNTIEFNEAPKSVGFIDELSIIYIKAL
jgi:hypothetical protein